MSVRQKQKRQGRKAGPPSLATKKADLAQDSLSGEQQDPSPTETSGVEVEANLETEVEVEANLEAAVATAAEAAVEAEPEVAADPTPAVEPGVDTAAGDALDVPTVVEGDLEPLTLDGGQDGTLAAPLESTHETLTAFDDTISDGDEDETSSNETSGAVDLGEVEAHPATLPAGDVSRTHLKGLIEALVFVSDRPVPLNDIAKSAGRADRKLVRSLVDELREEYRGRGIHLEEVAGGLLFRTNPAYGPFIRDAAAKKPVKMTRAQLEALAIIAYRQPLTRPEVDEIRGVDSGPVIKMLLERDLIRILGKKDEPGRPLLYGTTPVFLEFFGLKSLKDLPSLREFTELSDDSRKVFDREMSEVEGGAVPSADTLAAAASAVADDAAPTAPTREDFEEHPTTPSMVQPWGDAEPAEVRNESSASDDEPDTAQSSNPSSLSEDDAEETEQPNESAVFDDDPETEQPNESAAFDDDPETAEERGERALPDEQD